VSLADVVNRRILGRSQLGEPLEGAGATSPAAPVNNSGNDPVRTTVAAE
jgi:hypothetical protein